MASKLGTGSSGVRRGRNEINGTREDSKSASGSGEKAKTHSSRESILDSEGNTACEGLLESNDSERKHIKTDKPKSKRGKRKKSANEKPCSDTSSTHIAGRLLVNPASTGCSTSTLDEELEWCILQLQLSVLGQVATKPQKEQSQRNIRSLQSTKTPLPKKRQLMRCLCGDYRSKMKLQPTSALSDRLNLIVKGDRAEVVEEPKVLKTMGTFFRKKTESADCERVLIPDTHDEFKFNFSFPE